MATTNPITGDTIASKHLSGDAKRRFDESFDRIFGKPSDGQCKKCGGLMVKGKAIEQTYGGVPDFSNGEVVTVSPSGPGKLINCLKCEACGWSVT